MPLNECDEQLMVNECVNKLMEMSIEDIKNIEKYDEQLMVNECVKN